MKNLIITAVLLAILATSTTILAQGQQDDYLGLPGDNLNLYAVMKLFQESETIEGFEKSLNDQNSQINNLDLNGDNFVDYIKVLDYIDGDVHNIVMQVAINSRENQDVAVFTVQRFADGQVQIQLTGDEALYGRNYIIEPILNTANSGQTPNPGYYGNINRINGRNVYVTGTTTYQIANWPLIRFIYLPTYVVWRSSWYWDYYPSYWHTWRPYYWHYYYGYHYNWYNTYYGYYHRSEYHRYAHWNNFYYSSKRSYSKNVSYRIQAGHYKATYSRPDQRRQGEAMYNRSYQAQNNRTSNNSATNSNQRRSVSQATPVRQSSGNSTTRRPASNADYRSVNNQTSRQNTGTTGRSMSATNNQTASRPAIGQNMVTNRRATATTPNKVTSNQPSRQNVSQANRPTTYSANKVAQKSQVRQTGSTVRRSPTTTVNRSVTKPQSQTYASSARTPARSAPARVSNSNNRSNGSSKSGTTAQRSGKTQGSKSSETTRRR